MTPLPSWRCAGACGGQSSSPDTCGTPGGTPDTYLGTIYVAYNNNKVGLFNKVYRNVNSTDLDQVVVGLWAQGLT